MEIDIKIKDKDNGAVSINIDCNPPLSEDMDDTPAMHLAAAAVNAMKELLDVTEIDE